MKRGKDVLNSGNATVEWVISNAVRTFYPWEGCWLLEGNFHRNSVVQEVWEWSTDKHVPEGFHLESRCRTVDCVSPDCQALYQDDPSEEYQGEISEG